MSRVGQIAAPLVAVLITLNGLGGDFVLDDHPAILRNADMRPDSSWWQLLQHDFWGTPLTSPLSNKSYRPITVATFRLNYALSAAEPFGFHLVNTILHAAATYAVVVLAGRWMRGPVAVSTALLFATHPVHCEAVASIVGRAELLCCILYIWAFLLLCDTACKYGAVLGVILSLAALMCKEVAIVLPIMLLGHRALGPNGICLRTLGAASLLTAVMVVGSWWIRGGEMEPRFSMVDNPLGFLTSTTEWFAGVTYVHSVYAWLLLVPTRLCSDYSMGALLLPSAYTDLRILRGLALYTVSAALLYLSCCTTHQSNKETNLLRIAVLMLLFPFVPASHMFLSVGTLVAERLLYLPSVGFCMLLAIGLRICCSIVRHPFRQSVHAMCVGVIIGLYATQCLIRNSDWRSADDLATSAHRAYPSSAKVQLTRGVHMYKKSKFQAAQGQFEQAIVTCPQYGDAYYWLGRLAWQHDRFETAKTLLSFSLKLNTVHHHSHMFLGLTEARLHNDGAAATHLEAAIKISPSNAEAQRDFGIISYRTKQWATAAKHLELALKLMRLQPGVTSHKLAHVQLNLAAGLITQDPPS